MTKTTHTDCRLCEMLYISTSCMVKGSVFLLVLLGTVSARADYNRTLEDSCSSHKNCWQCVQDPCSRGEEVSNDCFWCNSFSWGGSGCAPLFQLQSCDQDVLDTKGCLPSEPYPVRDQIESTLDDPFIFTHADYMVSFPTGDISASKNQGNSRYDVWINMCNKLKDSRVVNLCGDFSPIEVVQQIASNREVCWDLGELPVQPMCSVKEEQDPGKGVTVQYGQARCCPTANVEAGNCIEIDVTVTMVTDHSDGSQESSVVQSFANMSILTGCSKDDSLNFVIATSQLTDINIDWRLDVAKSALHCQDNNEVHETWGEVLPCSLHPEPVVRGRIVSRGLSMKHFTVQLFYHNSTTAVRDLAEFPTWDDDILHFLVPVANLRGFEVDYSYPQNPTEPVTGGISNPVIFSKDSSSLPSWNSIAIGLGCFLVVVLVIVLIVLAYRNWKRAGYRRIDVPRRGNVEQVPVIVETDIDQQSCHPSVRHTVRPVESQPDRQLVQRYLRARKRRSRIVRKRTCNSRRFVNKKDRSRRNRTPASGPPNGNSTELGVGHHVAPMFDPAGLQSGPTAIPHDFRADYLSATSSQSTSDGSQKAAQQVALEIPPTMPSCNFSSSSSNADT